jgi:hypothetical protein
MHTFITQRRIAITIAALMAGLLVPSALAGQPFRERTETGSGFTIPAGGACSGAVAPDGVAFELVQGPWTTRYFENGDSLSSGTHVDRVTNVATGVSITVALHGSIAFSGNSFRASGRTGLVLFPGDAGPGDVDSGRFYVFTGDVRGQFDAFGVFTRLEWTGEPVDICALLD